MKRVLFLLPVLISVIVISCQKEISVENGENIISASTITNVAYGTDPLQNMDVYLPAGRSVIATKVIILVHGGAWILGDKSDFATFIDTLKQRFPEYAIFNINYRLSDFPNNVFPAQELDVKAAVEYIYNRRSEYLVGDKFVLLGASSGAHLSLLQAYKNSSPVKIKVVVDFFGPTDMNDLYNNPGIVTANNIAAIVGATPTTNPAIYQQSSPINFVSAASACPTIILQGGADPLVNAETQSGALRDKLQVAGVPVQYVLYPGKGHGDDWDDATFLDAFNKIQAFVNLYNP
jgi:acetyl esterase/lipase